MSRVRLNNLFSEQEKVFQERILNAAKNKKLHLFIDIILTKETFEKIIANKNLTYVKDKPIYLNQFFEDIINGARIIQFAPNNIDYKLGFIIEIPRNKLFDFMSSINKANLMVRILIEQHKEFYFKRNMAQSYNIIANDSQQIPMTRLSMDKSVLYVIMKSFYEMANFIDGNNKSFRLHKVFKI